MIRNTYETKLPDGTVIGFRSGTYAWATAQKECGAIDNNDFLKRLAVIDLFAANALYYGAAVQYHKWKHKTEPTFTGFDVSEWMDAISEEEKEKISAILLDAYVPKNAEPPMTGEKTQPEQPSTTGNS